MTQEELQQLQKALENWDGVVLINPMLAPEPGKFTVVEGKVYTHSAADRAKMIDAIGTPVIKS